MFRIFASAILYLGLWHFYSHYPLLSDGKYFYDRFDYLDFRDTKYFKALPFLTHKDDLPLGGPGVKYAFRINDSMLRVPCPSGSGDGIFAISPFSSSENTRFYLPKKTFYVKSREVRKTEPVNLIHLNDASRNKEAFSVFSSTSGNAVLCNGAESGIEDALNDARENGIAAWVLLPFLKTGPAAYKKSLSYDPGGGVLTESDSVSLNDRKRIIDVSAQLKKYLAMPGVKAAGLDFRDFKTGNFELAAEFMREMQIGAREEVSYLSPEQKSAWLAEKILEEGNRELHGMWQWYLTRKISLALKELKEYAGTDKTVFLLLSSGEIGIMQTLQDAGADIFILDAKDLDAARPADSQILLRFYSETDSDGIRDLFNALKKRLSDSKNLQNNAAGFILSI